MRLANRVYRPILGWALKRRKTVVAASIIALIASLACGTRLGTEFLPELNEGTIWVNVMLPPSISVTEAVKQTARVRAALMSVPEVETVVSKAGRPEDGTDNEGVNMSETFIRLKPGERPLEYECAENNQDLEHMKNPTAKATK